MLSITKYLICILVLNTAWSTFLMHVRIHNERPSWWMVFLKHVLCLVEHPTTASGYINTACKPITFSKWYGLGQASSSWISNNWLTLSHYVLQSKENINKCIRNVLKSAYEVTETYVCVTLLTSRRCPVYGSLISQLCFYLHFYTKNRKLSGRSSRNVSSMLTGWFQKCKVSRTYSCPLYFWLVLKACRPISNKEKGHIPNNTANQTPGSAAF